MDLRLNWTIVFLASSVVVFLLQAIGIFNWNLFAFTPALSLERPWTFVTSMFLHADFVHLFFNMFALLMFGLPLESRIGSGRYLAIFFISGIVGSIGYMATAGDSFIPAVGMSGAIYGIMGALAMLMPGATVFIGGFAPMPMIFAVFFWGISEFMGLFTPSNIARGAHLGGLLIGVLYGLYLRRKYSDRSKTRKTRISGYADWEK